MKNHECVIGLLCCADDFMLCTIPDLKNHIEDRKEFNKYIKPWSSETDLTIPEFTMKDYCDKRKSTNLSRFDFCPICGKKINWKEIRNYDEKREIE